MLHILLYDTGLEFISSGAALSKVGLIQWSVSCCTHAVWVITKRITYQVLRTYADDTHGYTYHYHVFVVVVLCAVRCIVWYTYRWHHIYFYDMDVKFNPSDTAPPRVGTDPEHRDAVPLLL